MKNIDTNKQNVQKGKADGSNASETPVPRAGIFRRLVALLIDMLPILVLVVLMIKGLAMIHQTYGVNDDFLGFMGFVLAFVIYFGYFAFFQSVVRKTPGEFCMFIKKGKYPGFGQAFKKSLLSGFARIFYLGLLFLGGYMLKMLIDMRK